MVTVIGHQKRKTEDGKEFNVVILHGGIETVKSKSSGKFYITARMANMVCTFDESTAKSMIGNKLPGAIVKQECPAYEYIVPESKEVVTLDYTYAYSREAAEAEEAVFENAG